MNDSVSVSGIVIRFILGGGAVAASYVLARLAGDRWGGIFAAFPAVYLASIITVAAGSTGAEGIPLTLQVSKGALIGMAANIVCAAALFMLIPRTGWKKGLVSALVIWAVCAAAIYAGVFKLGLMG